MRSPSPHAARRRASLLPAAGVELTGQAPARCDEFPDSIGLAAPREHQAISQGFRAGPLGEKREPFPTPFRVEPLQPQSHVAESDEPPGIRQAIDDGVIA
jgi:hypothetical protein